MNLVSNDRFFDMPSHNRFRILKFRTVFLLLLTTALGGCWALEQPNGSCLQYFPPFRDLMAMMYNANKQLSAVTPQVVPVYVLVYSCCSHKLVT